MNRLFTALIMTSALALIAGTASAQVEGAQAGCLGTGAPSLVSGGSMVGSPGSDTLLCPMAGPAVIWMFSLSESPVPLVFSGMTCQPTCTLVCFGAASFPVVAGTSLSFAFRGGLPAIPVCVQCAGIDISGVPCLDISDVFTFTIVPTG